MNFLRQLFGGNRANGTSNAPGNDLPAALSAAQAQERLSSDPKLYVLDVRQPEEYRAGHIPGAMLIPLGELGKRAGELPMDRDILCVCASGSRSSAATRHLRSLGYRAINMRGGMIGWRGSVKKGNSK